MSFTMMSHHVWSRLTEPCSSIVRVDERRQARLLASLLLTVIPLGAVSALVQLLIVPNFLPTFVILAMALSVLGLGYALSRSRHYRTGAILIVATISLACFGSIAFNPRDVIALAFVLLGVLAGAMLLSFRAVAAIIAADLVALVVTTNVLLRRPPSSLPPSSSSSAFDSSLIVGASMFFAIASGVVLIGVWHRDRLELDREGTLRESEARCRALIGAAFEGLILVREGRITELNDGWGRLLGVEPSTLKSKQLVDLFDTESHAAISEALVANRHTELGAFALAPNGRRIPVEVIIAPAMPATCLRAVAVRDLTAKQMLETQLRRADRLTALGTLTAAVAHELTDPLSYVFNSLEMVCRRHPGKNEDDDRDGDRAGCGGGGVGVGVGVGDDDDVARYLERAYEGAQRMRGIVHGLRAFTRGDDEKPLLKPINVEDVAEATLQMAEMHLRDRCRVVRDYQPVSLARANAPQLGQVLMNLLLNAAHAILSDDDRASSPLPNTIRLSVQGLEHDVVEVAISDTGRGISDEVLPQIFEPFFTTKPVGVGTGLGLWISQGIVRSFGGEIVVESEIGRGTTFRVRLPAFASTPPTIQSPVEIENVSLLT